jgi:hypothetical protein
MMISCADRSGHVGDRLEDRKHTCAEGSGAARLRTTRWGRTFVLSVVAVVIGAIMSATEVDAADASTNSREVRFGSTTMQIPNDLRVHSRWLSPEPSKASIIPEGESVFVSNSIVGTDYAKSCRIIPKIIFEHRRGLPRAARTLFDGVKSEATDHPGIRHLTADILQLFEFTAPDLRDVWNEQITFYTTDIKTDVSIQLTQNLAIRTAFIEPNCFFRNGEAILRELIKNVRGMILP